MPIFNVQAHGGACTGLAERPLWLSAQSAM